MKIFGRTWNHFTMPINMTWMRHALQAMAQLTCGVLVVQSKDYKENPNRSTGSCRESGTPAHSFRSRLLLLLTTPRKRVHFLCWRFLALYHCDCTTFIAPIPALPHLPVSERSCWCWWSIIFDSCANYNSRYVYGSDTFHCAHDLLLCYSGWQVLF